MNRRWLIVGLVLSLGLHGVVLWPLLTGSSSNEASEVAAESTPETVDVVAVAMPAPEAPAVAAPEPPAPAVPDPPAAMPEEEPSASESEILPELEPADEEPPAPDTRPLEPAPSEIEPPSPPTAVVEAEAPVEPAPVNESITPETSEATVAAVDVDRPETRESGSEPTPRIVRSRVAALLEKSSVVVEEASPVPGTTSRVAAMSVAPAPPVVVEETRPVPRTTSRTAAMSESRTVATVTPPRRDLPDGAEIQRRIEAANGRRRPTSTPNAVRNDHGGDHLSTQNGPAKVVPQIEWRSLARWRAVAGASGLRLIALSADGRPAVFIAESGGRWRRNPMPGRLSGYSARVRIVDHVAAFQPVRSCLQGDERLAILVPRSVESIMEAAMQEAMRRRSMQPSEVAVCSGVLQPDDRGRLAFRVDRITRRRSS